MKRNIKLEGLALLLQSLDNKDFIACPHPTLLDLEKQFARLAPMVESNIPIREEQSASGVESGKLAGRRKRLEAGLRRVIALTPSKDPVQVSYGLAGMIASLPGVEGGVFEGVKFESDHSLDMADTKAYRNGKEFGDLAPWLKEKTA